MHTLRNINHSPYLRPALLYAAWVGLFFTIFFQSWVSEDAYITFRVIDNFVHGYGLRWNIAERVQAYTHPLWLLLHLPFALLWPNLFQLNIALGVTCSSMAVGIVLLTFRKSAGITLVCFMLPLFLSKTFMDYSTSGLETSLSFLLFAALGYVLVRWQERRYFIFAVSLFSSLLLLNRLDHLVVLLPLLCYLGWHHTPALQTRHGMTMLLLGALPLIAWFCFSLFYYGFLFPNTKYAKLDTGFPLNAYLSQGAAYAFIWLTQDTVSVAVFALSLIMTIHPKTRGHWPVTFALALGIIINFSYVLYIGGDYMMGRFYAFIFFVSCWLVLALAPHKIRHDGLFALAAVMAVCTMFSYFVREIRGVCEFCIPMEGRVLDARGMFGTNSLFYSVWPPKARPEGQYKFAKDGRDLAAQNPPPVKEMRFIGMSGYYAGPRPVLIDDLGLADPLLSRLPAMTNKPFYVGHYQRGIPKGYMHAMETGKLDEMAPPLAKYYEKIRIITRDDLWSRERILTILRFNIGQYDHYRRAFLFPRR